jgi:hypothetical protein
MERRSLRVRFKPASIRSIEEDAVSSNNIIAAIVIIVVIVGGGAALYKLDNGHGNRTSADISAKTASD